MFPPQTRLKRANPRLISSSPCPTDQALAQSTSIATQTDGSLLFSGTYSLTQPADSVTFTPILPGHLTEENDWMAEDYEPTEEERKMAFSRESAINHQRRVSAFAETPLSHVDLYFAFTASAAAFAARRPEVTAHATQLDGMDSSPCTPPMTSPHA